MDCPSKQKRYHFCHQRIQMKLFLESCSLHRVSISLNTSNMLMTSVCSLKGRDLDLETASKVGLKRKNNKVDVLSFAAHRTVSVCINWQNIEGVEQCVVPLFLPKVMPNLMSPTHSLFYRKSGCNYLDLHIKLRLFYAHVLSGSSIAISVTQNLKVRRHK